MSEFFWAVVVTDHLREAEEKTARNAVRCFMSHAKESYDKEAQQDSSTRAISMRVPKQLAASCHGRWFLQVVPSKQLHLPAMQHHRTHA